MKYDFTSILQFMYEGNIYDVVDRAMKRFILDFTGNDKIKEGSWFEEISHPYKTNCNLFKIVEIISSGHNPTVKDITSGNAI